MAKPNYTNALTDARKAKILKMLEAGSTRAQVQAAVTFKQDGEDCQFSLPFISSVAKAAGVTIKRGRPAKAA